MSKKLVTLDASVLLKWIVPFSAESGVREALLIRDEYVQGKIDIVLPALWTYEVGNTLCRLYPKHAKDLISDLLAYGIAEHNLDQGTAAVAADLCARHRVTFYDAAYHAVAIVGNGTFVTADDKYVAKTKSAGSVLSLHNWQ